MSEDKLLWEKEYMDLAVKEILRGSNTNFDSLIKNVENNGELRNLVKRIILDNDYITYAPYNPVINLGIIYGILKEDEGNCKINKKVLQNILIEILKLALLQNLKIKLLV